jgi:hypothetical protein
LVNDGLKNGIKEDKVDYFKNCIIALEKVFLFWLPWKKLEGKIRKCLFFYVKIF